MLLLNHRANLQGLKSKLLLWLQLLASEMLTLRLQLHDPGLHTLVSSGWFLPFFPWYATLVAFGKCKFCTIVFWAYINLHFSESVQADCINLDGHFVRGYLAIRLGKSVSHRIKK